MAGLPYSYPENVTSFLSLLHYANDAVGGFFGVGILVVIALITFLSTKMYSFERSFAMSAFFTFLAGLLLKFMSLIPDGAFFATIAYLVGAMVMLWIEREKEVT